MIESIDAQPSAASGYRFSGHETFACRYAWLPKAYRLLKTSPNALSNEDGAMIELGLGKNMVRSLRFWAEVTDLAEAERGRGLELTDFAHAVFGRSGFDPYLEDVRTLWLLHWNISSRANGALFAWRFLLNQWPYPEFTRTEAFNAFVRESSRLGHSHSSITLSQHLDIFLHTYYSARSMSVGVEDSLDGPLVDLALLQVVGERKVDGARRESVYGFRRESKDEITPALFDYCLDIFWRRFHPLEETLTLREVALGMCSPGQAFKLPEDDIRARLETYAGPGTKRPFAYQPSAVQGLLSRRKGATISLSDVYERGAAHA